MEVEAAMSAFNESACAHARLNKPGEALRDLRKAIELHARNRDDARTDDDFTSLRDDPGFRKLVGSDDDSAEGEDRPTQ